MTIHEQLKELGGIESITAELPDWPVSDDTVMHLATAEGQSTARRPYVPPASLQWIQDEQEM